MEFSFALSHEKTAVWYVNSHRKIGISMTDETFHLNPLSKLVKHAKALLWRTLREAKSSIAQEERLLLHLLSGRAPPAARSSSDIPIS